MLALLATAVALLTCTHRLAADLRSLLGMLGSFHFFGVIGTSKETKYVAYRKISAYPASS